MCSAMAEVLSVEREEAFWAGVENARRFLSLDASLRAKYEELWQAAQTAESD